MPTLTLLGILLDLWEDGSESGRSMVNFEVVRLSHYFGEISTAQLGGDYEVLFSWGIVLERPKWDLQEILGCWPQLS